MQPVEIPQRVDDPVHLLLWSLDEMAPIILGLVGGIAVNQAMFGVVIGMVVSNFYRRYRDNHPDGYLLHMTYRAGFNFSRAPTMVNPFIRRFLP